MFIAWWTGKGYQTLLIIFGTLAVCGLLLSALPPSMDNRWFWASALVLAAIINWGIGSKINRLRRSKAQGRARLLYRAHHRFMSMPMETFSIPVIGVASLVAAGAFIS